MTHQTIIGAAILGVALIVAAAFGRYEISAGEGARLYRLDRLTGRVETCVAIDNPQPEELQPAWCAYFHVP